jgi:hypothetical protein
MTKKEAVEKGLGALGTSATPSQLQKHIKATYDIDMGLKHIATAKAKILKAGGAKAASAKPAAVRRETGKTATPKAHGVQEINLRDIETVKDLLERVGPASLKKLIDVMAR